MKCNKCGNELGFVFKTCNNCGWNCLSNQFEFIKVLVDDLPEDIQDHLVEIHARRYENIILNLKGDNNNG